ncbi:MAG: F0F1 ATP synthase subunit A [Phycisphaerae bacterium]|nr:F0F1 ATP synthase subunit A [Phycisphaerae bacterium]
MFNLASGLLAEVNPLEEVVVKELFSFELFGARVVFSNHMFMVSLGALLLMIFLPLALRGKGLIRRGFGNLIEATCLFIREDVARPFLGDSTDKHIGFLWTLFFFILTLNLLGMVPLAGIIYLLTGKPNHLGGAATANIWVVGSLALLAFLAIHVGGIREQGLAHYLKNFIPKVPWPMAPFIYMMEIIGALVKPVSLTVRLFANIFAGHILVATLFLFIVIFKNYAVSGLTVTAVVAASLLELLVAFLQAYIFTFLSAIFMGLAIHPEH